MNQSSSSSSPPRRLVPALYSAERRSTDLLQWCLLIWCCTCLRQSPKQSSSSLDSPPLLDVSSHHSGLHAYFVVFSRRSGRAVLAASRRTQRRDQSVRGTSTEKRLVFFSHNISYTPIRDVRRPNDERNAPAESNKNAALSTETQSEVGPSDGCGDYDGYGYYEGCGDCGDCGGCGGCEDSDSDSGGTAARTEKCCKRYPASTSHNARHEPR